MPDFLLACAICARYFDFDSTRRSCQCQSSECTFCKVTTSRFILHINEVSSLVTTFNNPVFECFHYCFLRFNNSENPEVTKLQFDKDWTDKSMILIYLKDCTKSFSDIFLEYKNAIFRQLSKYISK